MTIQLQRQRGRVTLYGSFEIQNPNEAFHSFMIESSGSVFVSPQDAQSPNSNQRQSKRQVRRNAETGSSGQYSNATLYVSIEGQEDSSAFIMKTTFGNTCKLLEFFLIARCSF